ncbi:hypothetical protein NBRC10513v2_006377 [Rhodotorula toruloides]
MAPAPSPMNPPDSLTAPASSPTPPHPPPTPSLTARPKKKRSKPSGTYGDKAGSTRGHGLTSAARAEPSSSTRIATYIQGRLRALHEEKAEEDAINVLERLESASGVKELLELAGEERIDIALLTTTDLTKLGDDARSIVLSDESAPFSEIIALVRSVRKTERDAKLVFRRMARAAQKEVHVHLLRRSTPEQIKFFRGSHIFSVDGESPQGILIHRYLPRPDHPALDLFFDLDMVLARPDLDWLTRRPDPSRPLTPEEFSKLRLDDLIVAKEKSPLYLGRLDLTRSYSDELEFRALGTITDTSIAVRNPAKRGVKRGGDGVAVQQGVRVDRQGKYGTYRNLNNPSSFSYSSLHRLLADERLPNTAILSLVETLAPSLLCEWQESTIEADMPSFSTYAVGGTASAMRGWRAVQHIEKKGDASWTWTLGFGGREEAPRGTGGFVVTAYGGMRPVAVEGGVGTGFFFRGEKDMHGTVSPYTPHGFLEPEQLTRLANLTITDDPLPPLPKQPFIPPVLPEAQQARGWCKYPKEGLFATMSAKRADGKDVARPAPRGTGGGGKFDSPSLSHVAARAQPSSSSTSSSPNFRSTSSQHSSSQPRPRTLNGIVSHSGDSGAAENPTATVAFLSASTRETRAAMRSLPAEARQKIETAAMERAVSFGTSEKRAEKVFRSG